MTMERDIIMMDVIGAFFKEVGPSIALALIALILAINMIVSGSKSVTTAEMQAYLAAELHKHSTDSMHPAAKVADTELAGLISRITVQVTNLEQRMAEYHSR